MDGLTLRAEDFDALTPELLDRVAQGEAVEITRGGAVVVKVVATPPLPPKLTPGERTALIAHMLENREKLRQMGVTLTQEEIRAFRDDHSA
jgi:antitoxin (DNA-binding transcriptional repressor) of toxin-antitoxin stability system